MTSPGRFGTRGTTIVRPADGCTYTALPLDRRDGFGAGTVSVATSVIGRDEARVHLGGEEE